MTIEQIQKDIAGLATAIKDMEKRFDTKLGEIEKNRLEVPPQPPQAKSGASFNMDIIMADSRQLQKFHDDFMYLLKNYQVYSLRGEYKDVSIKLNPTARKGNF